MWCERTIQIRVAQVSVAGSGHGVMKLWDFVEGRKTFPVM